MSRTQWIAVFGMCLVLGSSVGCDDEAESNDGGVGDGGSSAADSGNEDGKDAASGSDASTGDVDASLGADASDDAQIDEEDAGLGADAAVADSGLVDAGPTEPLEIIGVWAETGMFGGTRTITSTVSLFDATIIEYDNEANWVITQNPSTAPYYANKYGKVFWTEIEDYGFYYCAAEYMLDTLEQARSSTNIPDPSHLEACGFGAWSHLTDSIEIPGLWYFDSQTERITNTKFFFGDYIADANNDENWVITENGYDDKYSKTYWTEPESGVFYYCGQEYSLATLAAARASTHEPDATDLASGCGGGFPWSRVVPALELHGEWWASAANVTISSEAWGDDAVVSYDNAQNSAITQNASGAVHPLKFNKIVWTEIASNAFNYCLASANQDSAALALSAASTPTKTDLVTGCSGGPWTAVTVIP